MNIGKVLSSSVLLLLLLNLISKDFNLDWFLFLKILITSSICTYCFFHSSSKTPPKSEISTLKIPTNQQEISKNPFPPTSERIPKNATLCEKYQNSDLPIKKLSFDNLEPTPADSFSSLSDPSEFSIEPSRHIKLSPRPQRSECLKHEKKPELRLESKKILEKMRKNSEKNTQAHLQRLEDLRKNYEEMIENSKVDYDLQGLMNLSEKCLKIVEKTRLPGIIETKEPEKTEKNEKTEAASDFNPKLNEAIEFKGLEAVSDFNPRPLGSKDLEKSAFELQLKNLEESNSDPPAHLVLPVHRVKPFTTREPVLNTPADVSLTEYQTKMQPLTSKSFLPQESISTLAVNYEQNSGNHGFFMKSDKVSNFLANESNSAQYLTGINPFKAVENNPFKAVENNPFKAPTSVNNPFTVSISESSSSSINPFSSGSSSSFNLQTNLQNPFTSRPSNSFNLDTKPNFSSNNPFTSERTSNSSVQKNPFTSQSESFSMKFESNPSAPPQSSLKSIPESGYTTPVNPVYKYNLSSQEPVSRPSYSENSSRGVPASFSQTAPTPTVPAGRTTSRTSLTTVNTSDFHSLEISRISLESYSQIKGLIPIQERSLKSCNENLLIVINDFYTDMPNTEQFNRFERIVQVFSKTDSNKLSILAVNFAFYCIDSLIENDDDSDVLLRFCEYFVKVFIALEKEFKSICSCLLFELQTRCSVFAGKTFTEAEVEQSWRLEDLKRLSEGGVLQNKIQEEMKQLETLASFQTIFFIETNQVKEIYIFLSQLKTTPRQVLPVLVGILKCLQCNPRLSIVENLKSLIIEHGSRIENSKQFCNQLFFIHEILKFKELFNRIYGFN